MKNRKTLIQNIVLITVIALLTITATSHADEYYPLLAPHYGRNTYGDFMSEPNEQRFIDLYNLAESDLVSEQAFKAFSLMFKIASMSQLAGKMREDVSEGFKRHFREIKSKELRALLKKIIAATKEPKNAKDAFYKGLLTHSPPASTRLSPQMFETFESVISEFPATVYAKYSYFFLADNYMLDALLADLEVQTEDADKRQKSAEAALMKYLENYGKNDELKPYAYLALAELYSKRVKRDSKAFSQMMKYSEKLLNEYPDRKYMTSRALLILGDYYRIHTDEYGYAIEYYDMILSNDDYAGHYAAYTLAASGVRDVCKSISGPMRINEILTDHERGLYRRYKRYAEEFRRFEYDAFFPEADVNKSAYEKSGAEIEKFREEYEKYFDEDDYLLKPFN